MDKSTFLEEQGQELLRALSKAFFTVEGWIGALGTAYFSSGSVGQTIFGLCICDLLSGSMLALKITRYLKGNRDEGDFPELEALVKIGKKHPFEWSRWFLWAEKLAVTFICIFGCELFRIWAVHDRPWVMVGIDLSISLVYFVLIFANLRSIIRNVALVTENRLLLDIWMWMGTQAQAAIDSALKIKEEEKRAQANSDPSPEPTQDRVPTIPGSP